MSEKFVIPPELLNFTLSPNLNLGNLYQPGTFGGDSYWNSIFGGLGIDTSKPAPSVTEFVPAPPPDPNRIRTPDYLLPEYLKGAPNHLIRFLEQHPAYKVRESYSDVETDPRKLINQFTGKPFFESATPSIVEIQNAYDVLNKDRQKETFSSELGELWRQNNIHWHIGGADRARELASILSDQGIYGTQDLAKLGKQGVEGGRYTLASRGGEDGTVNYDVVLDAEGNVQGIVPQWQPESNFFADILPVLGILAMPFTGGLSAALGGGLAGTIGANALIQGGLGGLAAEASGGDFLSGFGKGALTGGITGGLSSLAAPVAQGIGADVLSSTGSQTLADIASGAIKGAAGSLPSALISGDASNLLTGAFAGGVGGGTKNVFSDLPESIRAPVTAAVTSGLLGKDPTEAAIRAFAGDLMKSGPTMPGAGTSEDIQEGFFEPGGPGFMPTEFLDDAEVDRELQSLLGRYPASQPPSDWFLGENIMSGVPEWDMAAVNAGLPIGNLEQDFSVAQAKEGPQIVDSAGNVGNFVNGEFVVDTGVTPNLSYAATSAPAPSPRAPAPAPAPAPASSGFDPSLLFMLGAMMTPQQQKQQEEQMAPARAVPSPFGMNLLV